MKNTFTISDVLNENQSDRKPREKDLKERFFKFINIKKALNTDECWNWQGTLDRKNYGTLIVKRNGINRRFFAHRVSYVIHYGVEPEPLIQVCHSCDNPSCVNPNHLFLGTNRDNILDRVAKNRSHRNGPGKSALKGEANYSSKLTEGDVRDIFDLYQFTKMSQKDIAELFNVSTSTINNILNGLLWQHLNLKLSSAIKPKYSRGEDHPQWKHSYELRHQVRKLYLQEKSRREICQALNIEMYELKHILKTNNEILGVSTPRNTKKPTVFGETHHKAKLSEKQVACVRYWLNQGASRTNLARKLNVSKYLIDRIAVYKTWATIKPELNDSVGITNLENLNTFTKERTVFKYSDELRTKIKDCYRIQNLNKKQLAEKFNISETTASRIIKE